MLANSWFIFGKHILYLSLSCVLTLPWWENVCASMTRRTVLAGAAAGSPKPDRLRVRIGQSTTQILLSCRIAGEGNLKEMYAEDACTGPRVQRDADMWRTTVQCNSLSHNITLQPFTRDGDAENLRGSAAFMREIGVSVWLNNEEVCGPYLI